VLVVAQLALEYGFTDIDGKQPRPINVDEELELVIEIPLIKTELRIIR
jgi:hypothetical protein